MLDVVFLFYHLFSFRVQNKMGPTVLHEVLEVKYESRNCHDRYAIAVMKHLPGTLVASVVPREISRCTYFIIIHGAKVSCKVMDVHHRRSPLVQGGLEIPCQLIVEMEMTDKKSLAIAEYKRLVSEQYQEPYLPYHRVYCGKRKVSR